MWEIRVIEVNIGCFTHTACACATNGRWAPEVVQHQLMLVIARGKELVGKLFRELPRDFLALRRKGITEKDALHAGRACVLITSAVVLHPSQVVSVRCGCKEQRRTSFNLVRGCS